MKKEADDNTPFTKMFDVLYFNSNKNVHGVHAQAFKLAYLQMIRQATR